MKGVGETGVSPWRKNQNRGVLRSPDKVGTTGSSEADSSLAHQDKVGYHIVVGWLKIGRGSSVGRARD